MDLEFKLTEEDLALIDNLGVFVDEETIKATVGQMEIGAFNSNSELYRSLHDAYPELFNFTK